MNVERWGGIVFHWGVFSNYKRYFSSFFGWFFFIIYIDFFSFFIFMALIREYGEQFDPDFSAWIEVWCHICCLVQMVYKKQTKFGFVGRYSCPGAKGWKPRKRKFRIAVLVLLDWHFSKHTMTWLHSKTSSAYSRRDTKASFEPLSFIWDTSTKT